MAVEEKVEAQAYRCYNNACCVFTGPASDVIRMSSS